MKKVSKICLGLITVFSLTACKGTKVSRAEFCEEASKIEKDNFNTAKLTYKEVTKEGFVIIDKKEDIYKGTYVKNKNGSWNKSSEKNDSIADDTFFDMLSKMKLNKDFIGVSIINNYSKKVKEAYYIKPFSYESSYKIEEDYRSSNKSYLNEKRKYSTVDTSLGFKSAENYTFEWNDYGYLTLMEYTKESKREYEEGPYSIYKTLVVKIEYK